MTDPQAMKALRIAAPYLSRFRDRVLVIKLGGDVLEGAALPSIADQIAMLWQVGIRVMLVHGGGGAIDTLCGRLGVKTEKVAGRRVTSPEAVAAIEMTLGGSVQIGLMKALRRAQLPAIGLTGLDANLIVSKRRPPVEVGGKTVDYGEVGDVQSVDPKVLFDILNAGYVPVVAPLTADAEGSTLNTNADTVAAELAIALNAHKLLFVVGVPGLCRDVSRPETLIPYATWEQIERLKAEGVVSGGMLPKLDAAKQALDHGVSAVHLVGGGLSDSLLTELFTNEGSGTMIDLGTQ